MPVSPVMIPINWRGRKGSSTKKKCANAATISGTEACSIATTALSTRLTATAVKTLVSHPFVVPNTIMWRKFFQPECRNGSWLRGSVRPRNASQTSSADMAMNPRDAANAKGCIDSVISFTKTKLLPHVPEITIRFIHSVENRKLPMPRPNQLQLLTAGSVWGKRSYDQIRSIGVSGGRRDVWGVALRCATSDCRILSAAPI